MLSRSLAILARCVGESFSAGLLSTYASLFELGDSLADIKTRADLFDYLRMVSARARDLQPSSSSYLVEETGEVKLLAGSSLSPLSCRAGSCGDSCGAQRKSAT